MIKKLTFAAIAGGVFLMAPGQAQSQVTLGPTVAFHDEFDFGIGAMVGAPIPALAEGVGFLGDFTLFFPDQDNVDVWQLNGNITWDIPIENAAIAPFLLGGLNFTNWSVEVTPGEDVDDTEMGLNLGGGFRFDAGTLEPLVGLRAELNEFDGLVIFAALPFSLGG